MEISNYTTSYFLQAFIVGLTIFSILPRPEDFGMALIRLFRLIIGIGLWLLGLVLMNKIVFALALVWTVVAFYLRERRQYGLYFVLLSSNLSLVLYLLNFNWPSFFFVLFTGMVIGIITYGMCLGHWYLVVPKLSNKPLLKAIKIFLPVVSLKILLILIMYIYGHNSYAILDSGPERLFNYLLLFIRFLFGPIILTVLGILTWKLVKMRSIMSATGVLYIMVFFGLMSELIAVYLFSTYGLYL